VGTIGLLIVAGVRRAPIYTTATVGGS
jgi:hypothetical protein